VETKVLMLGDISGKPGMGALFLGLSRLIKDSGANLVVINGENAADGFGITEDDYYRMKEYGADVITSGNHIWQKEDIYPLLDGKDDLLRPCNYPDGVRGKGVCMIDKGPLRYAVINAQGRHEMPITDCPFKKVREIVQKVRKETPLIFVDFHAESTMEKEALGFFLDGEVTAVVGTHTHVQTMDEKILPKGTAYITDIGMTGVQHAVIGSEPQRSIERQLSQVPIKSLVAEGVGEIKGVLITADAESGKAIRIERL